MRHDNLVAPWATGVAPGTDGANRVLERRWEGRGAVKPWQRRVTATFAQLETPELVPTVIDLLRNQSLRPHIIIVDTGSSQDTIDQLEEMRAPDVEIHYVRSHAYRHSSAPVSVACDLAMALCTTDLMFFTHVDVFLCSRTFLETLADMTSRERPLVGYRMSDRTAHGTDQWKNMVGHTATMLHMPTVHRIGATWNIERCHAEFGIPRNPQGGQWPDTETGINMLFQREGIAPTFIGEDTNYERFVDGNIDHCRSFPGSKLYDNDRPGSYHEGAAEWIKVALDEAQQRIKKWQPQQRP